MILLGVKVKRQQMTISHLQYANDTLDFCLGDLCSLKMVEGDFPFSGLLISLPKSFQNPS